jgi:hypothetical protein
MYKQVFQNSKVALLFAGMTLISAVSMVGTPDDSGVLTKAVDLVESQSGAFARDPQASAEGSSTGDNSGGTGPVFGDFNDAADPVTAGAPASANQGSNPMNAPMSATAVVSEGGGPTVSAEPFVSDREMTIEPE